MEDDAARFGAAVGLDSASTSSASSTGPHYFMEVNTRIQVEHGSPSFCYSLGSGTRATRRLLRRRVAGRGHGAARPAQGAAAQARRIPRFKASVEARLNATDASLSPHAGGLIRFWSKPIEGEIPRRPGHQLVNPDTGMFMRYRVAGAYDSNIALLLTQERTGRAAIGCSRRCSDRRACAGEPRHEPEFTMAWSTGSSAWNVMAKPTTRFVVPYLTLVVQLKDEANRLDIGFAFAEMKKHYAKQVAAESGGDAAAVKAISEVLDRKLTLLTRPMEILLEDPHLLSGWLS